MAAPGGFDPTKSLLPEGGGTIYAMHGGGSVPGLIETNVGRSMIPFVPESNAPIYRMDGGVNAPMEPIPGQSVNASVQSQGTLSGQSVNAPVQQVNAPAQSVNPSVQQVNAPAQSVNPSVQQVNAPSQSVNPPVQQVNAPSQPVNPPVQQVNAPAQSVNPSVQQVNAPSQPVNVPAQSVNPPVQQVNAPAQSVNPSVQQVNAPAQSVNPSVQQVNAPAQSVNPSVQQVNAPAQSVNPPVQPVNAPVQQENTSVKPANAPSKENKKENKKANQKPVKEEPIEEDEKRMNVFGESLVIKKPTSKTTTFTNDQKKAIALFGIENASKTFQTNVLQALYDGRCDTTKSLVTMESCEPIRKIIQGLALHLLTKMQTEYNQNTLRSSILTSKTNEEEEEESSSSTKNIQFSSNSEKQAQLEELEKQIQGMGESIMTLHGIQNPTATSCYCNSSIQLLFSIPEIRTDLLSYRCPFPLTSERMEEKQFNEEGVLCALHELFVELNDKTTQIENPDASSFEKAELALSHEKVQYLMNQFKMKSGSKQDLQDASEFIQFIFKLFKEKKEWKHLHDYASIFHRGKIACDVAASNQPLVYDEEGADLPELVTVLSIPQLIRQASSFPQHFTEEKKEMDKQSGPIQISMDSLLKSYEYTERKIEQDKCEGKEYSHSTSIDPSPSNRYLLFNMISATFMQGLSQDQKDRYQFNIPPRITLGENKSYVYFGSILYTPAKDDKVAHYVFERADSVGIHDRSPDSLAGVTRILYNDANVGIQTDEFHPLSKEARLVLYRSENAITEWKNQIESKKSEVEQLRLQPVKEEKKEEEKEEEEKEEEEEVEEKEQTIEEYKQQLESHRTPEMSQLLQDVMALSNESLVQEIDTTLRTFKSERDAHLREINQFMTSVETYTSSLGTMNPEEEKTQYDMLFRQFATLQEDSRTMMEPMESILQRFEQQSVSYKNQFISTLFPAYLAFQGNASLERDEKEDVLQYSSKEDKKSYWNARKETRQTVQQPFLDAIEHLRRLPNELEEKKKESQETLDAYRSQLETLYSMFEKVFQNSPEEVDLASRYKEELLGDPSLFKSADDYFREMLASEEYKEKMVEIEKIIALLERKRTEISSRSSRPPLPSRSPPRFETDVARSTNLSSSSTPSGQIEQTNPKDEMSKNMSNLSASNEGLNSTTSSVAAQPAVSSNGLNPNQAEQDDQQEEQAIQQEEQAIQQEQQDVQQEEQDAQQEEQDVQQEEQDAQQEEQDDQQEEQDVQQEEQQDAQQEEQQDVQQEEQDVQQVEQDAQQDEQDVQQEKQDDKQVANQSGGNKGDEQIHEKILAIETAREKIVRLLELYQRKNSDVIQIYKNEHVITLYNRIDHHLQEDHKKDEAILTALRDPKHVLSKEDIVAIRKEHIRLEIKTTIDRLKNEFNERVLTLLKEETDFAKELGKEFSDVYLTFIQSHSPDVIDSCLNVFLNQYEYDLLHSLESSVSDYQTSLQQGEEVKQTVESKMPNLDTSIQDIQGNKTEYDQLLTNKTNMNRLKELKMTMKSAIATQLDEINTIQEQITNTLLSIRDPDFLQHGKEKVENVIQHLNEGLSELLKLKKEQQSIQPYLLYNTEDLHVITLITYEEYSYFKDGTIFEPIQTQLNTQRDFLEEGASRYNSLVAVFDPAKEKLGEYVTILQEIYSQLGSAVENQVNQSFKQNYEKNLGIPSEKNPFDIPVPLPSLEVINGIKGQQGSFLDDIKEIEAELTQLAERYMGSKESVSLLDTYEQKEKEWMDKVNALKENSLQVIQELEKKSSDLETEYESLISMYHTITNKIKEDEKKNVNRVKSKNQNQMSISQWIEKQRIRSSIRSQVEERNKEYIEANQSIQKHITDEYKQIEEWDRLIQEKKEKKEEIQREEVQRQAEQQRVKEKEAKLQSAKDMEVMELEKAPLEQNIRELEEEIDSQQPNEQLSALVEKKKQKLRTLQELIAIERAKLGNYQPSNANQYPSEPSVVLQEILQSNLNTNQNKEILSRTKSDKKNREKVKIYFQTFYPESPLSDQHVKELIKEIKKENPKVVFYDLISNMDPSRMMIKKAMDLGFIPPNSDEYQEYIDEFMEMYPTEVGGLFNRLENEIDKLSISLPDLDNKSNDYLINAMRAFNSLIEQVRAATMNRTHSFEDTLNEVIQTSLRTLRTKYENERISIFERMAKSLNEKKIEQQDYMDYRKCIELLYAILDPSFEPKIFEELKKTYNNKIKENEESARKREANQREKEEEEKKQVEREQSKKNRNQAYHSLLQSIENGLRAFNSVSTNAPPEWNVLEKSLSSLYDTIEGYRYSMKRIREMSKEPTNEEKEKYNGELKRQMDQVQADYQAWMGISSSLRQLVPEKQQQVIQSLMEQLVNNDTVIGNSLFEEEKEVLERNQKGYELFQEERQQRKSNRNRAEKEKQNQQKRNDESYAGILRSLRETLPLFDSFSRSSKTPKEVKDLEIHLNKLYDEINTYQTRLKNLAITNEVKQNYIERMKGMIRDIQTLHEKVNQMDIPLLKTSSYQKISELIRRLSADQNQNGIPSFVSLSLQSLTRKNQRNQHQKNYNQFKANQTRRKTKLNQREKRIQNLKNQKQKKHAEEVAQLDAEIKKTESNLEKERKSFSLDTIPNPPLPGLKEHYGRLSINAKSKLKTDLVNRQYTNRKGKPAKILPEAYIKKLINGVANPSEKEIIAKIIKNLKQPDIQKLEEKIKDLKKQKEKLLEVNETLEEEEEKLPPVSENKSQKNQSSSNLQIEINREVDDETSLVTLKDKFNYKKPLHKEELFKIFSRYNFGNEFIERFNTYVQSKKNQINTNPSEANRFIEMLIGEFMSRIEEKKNNLVQQKTRKNNK